MLSLANVDTYYGDTQVLFWAGLVALPLLAARRVVRDVMVAGRWVIGEGHHGDEEAILARYRQTVKRLLA